MLSTSFVTRLSNTQCDGIDEAMCTVGVKTPDTSSGVQDTVELLRKVTEFTPNRLKMLLLALWTLASPDQPGPVCNEGGKQDQG